MERELETNKRALSAYEGKSQEGMTGHGCGEEKTIQFSEFLSFEIPEVEN